MVGANVLHTKQQVKQQHIKCLEQQSFLHELEGLLEDALACIEPAKEARAADKELKTQGFKCSHRVYQAVHDHLEVVRCTQRLQLPNSATSRETPDAVCGSLSHVFGVVPEQLIALQVPDLAAAQEGCQALLPEVEARVLQKVQWLARLFDFKGATTDLPQHVAAQVAGVKSGHQEVLDQWQQQQHASRDHLQALQQALGSMTDLVTDHLLGVQQEADQVQQSWLQTHSQTLSAKLQVIEKQLLAQTYTADTMPALHKIDDSLAKAQRQLDARDQKVSTKLYRFEQLGPEIVELAAKYRELQEDLDHATFTLQEFKKAAQDQQ